MLILAQLLEGRLLVRISSSNARRKMSLWSPNSTQNSTWVRSSDLGEQRTWLNTATANNNEKERVRGNSSSSSCTKSTDSPASSKQAKPARSERARDSLSQPCTAAAVAQRARVIDGVRHICGQRQPESKGGQLFIQIMGEYRNDIKVYDGIRQMDVNKVQHVPMRGMRGVRRAYFIESCVKLALNDALHGGMHVQSANIDLVNHRLLRLQHHHLVDVERAEEMLSPCKVINQENFRFLSNLTYSYPSGAP